MSIVLRLMSLHVLHEATGCKALSLHAHHEATGGKALSLHAQHEAHLVQKLEKRTLARRLLRQSRPAVAVVVILNTFILHLF